MVKIELVYAPLDRKIVHLFLEVKPGLTVYEVLRNVGIYEDYAETQGSPVGIYSKQVTLDTVVHHGDRLEIYRPLTLDPKETRRQRARSLRKTT
jgi:putative ubiquitin-RnfH superfamily antitoxin RatB of RatAB toxin-antitoxin module